MAIKRKNTSTEAKVLRPDSAESYMPEPGSALESVSKQARGETADERSLGDVRKHTHDGSNSRKIHIRNLEGLIRTVAAVPTWTPTNFFDQIVLYDNAGTYSLYIYETTSGTWVSEVLS